MHFQIIGEIFEIETFATGSGIAKLLGCEDSTDALAGANAGESLAFG